MNNIDTKHLRELRAAATAGAVFNPDLPDRALGWQRRQMSDVWQVYGDNVEHIAMVKEKTNANVIVAAVNSLVPLCDEVDSLRAQLAEAKALLRRVHSWGFDAECDADDENASCWERLDALLAKDGGA